jgi:alpha-ketoglutarate-dependent taurine dioxygenase
MLVQCLYYAYTSGITTAATAAASTVLALCTAARATATGRFYMTLALLCSLTQACTVTHTYATHTCTVVHNNTSLHCNTLTQACAAMH